jgi:hypothetical protein
MRLFILYKRTKIKKEWLIAPLNFYSLSMLSIEISKSKVVGVTIDPS